MSASNSECSTRNTRCREEESDRSDEESVGGEEDTEGSNEDEEMEWSEEDIQVAEAWEEIADEERNENSKVDDVHHGSPVASRCQYYTEKPGYTCPSHHSSFVWKKQRRILPLDLIVLWIYGTEVCAETRYSVAEEVNGGSLVGNVAKDLGLDITSLTDRRFRVVSENENAFFDVNQDSGDLFVLKKIDREELCQGGAACLMELKIIVENPLEIHYVVVEIKDVNDHAPVFPEKEQSFEIFEQTSPGTRFQLHAARDPDAGSNTIRAYTLTSNEHFDIDVRQSDEDKIPFLVLKKSLDREQRSKHVLYVTAVDGGKPPRSGALNVSVIVLDSNDNRPKFSQESYQIDVEENVPIGISIFKINATDPDEGTNSQIEYSLGKTLKKKVYNIFDLDKITGEIRVKGAVDYEENDVYKLDIEASDKGTPPLKGECRLIVKIKDVNDNPPEIDITSLSNKVPEDSKPGTIISLISVKDKDSGLNGKIIASISSEVPFELKPSYKENTYSIVTKGFLDREEISSFEITIRATDCGEPPLSAFKTLTVQLTDINDNTPQFSQNPINIYLSENNKAGEIIFSVSATDKDVNDNAVISYQILRDGRNKDMTSFLNINSENGQITALKSFDFESLKTFQFQVVPKEAFAASDVKSAAPDDDENNVTFYLIITLGSVSVLFLISIIVLIAMQCSKSTDFTSKYLQEANYDGTLCHSIQYRSGDKRYMLVGPRMSIGSTMVPGSHANTLVLPDRRKTSEEETLWDFMEY
ncbi:protocadherin alpha-6-like [Nematolebias whitei]|uniref:protocadherin alpha-6-like n=1 Tax=Nematolebias whitei TaxID=451745 RepID=UPI00189A3583|nr:protocadherin alpha-6-like [Nematolebias whitei]